MKSLFTPVQSAFPDVTTRVIIYPADFTFCAVLALAKIFMTAEAADRLQPMMYLSGVEKYIDRKHIPKAMVTSTMT